MNSAAPEPAESYLHLRQLILNLNPSEAGLAPTELAPRVWGVLMETGYDVGTVTLVSLADGTTSLYFSTGGGMIGSSDYNPVALASQALVEEAEKHVSNIAPTTDYPLPGVGQVRFYLLTYQGIHMVDSAENDLASGSHPLEPLYQRAQETLTQLRLLSDKKKL